MEKGKKGRHESRFVRHGYDSGKKRKWERFFYYLLVCVAAVLLLTVMYVMFIGN